MLKKYLPAAAVGLLLAFVVPACRSKPAADNTQSSAPSSSNEGVSPWKIELKVAPEHPRMVQPVTLTVHIVDGAGKSVDNVQVTGSLTMKTMDMGKTEVKFAPKGNGDYEGTMKALDMAGPWELAVEAKQGDFHALKKFEIVINE